jgi:hypothetical protein
MSIARLFNSTVRSQFFVAVVTWLYIFRIGILIVMKIY